MNRWQFFIFFCLFFYLATDLSYAGAVLYRIQMMKRARQQPSQQQYDEYMAQQQGQGQQGNGQNPQAPAPPSYQQTVDQRNQAIAQAIIDAHQKSVSNQAPANNNGVVNQVQPTPVAIQQPVPSTTSQVEDTVDLSEVWQKLDNKSTVWPLLMDDQAKLMTVTEYITRFRNQGVKINAPATHYVQMIDQIALQNPSMLDKPFGELLQILAIVDYDFDNGMDKDDLAKKVLGEAGFEANQKRLLQAQQAAQQQQQQSQQQPQPQQ